MLKEPIINIESSTNSINSQKNYIKNIRKNGNQVYQLQMKEVITATSGFPVFKEKDLSRLLII